MFRRIVVDSLTYYVSFITLLLLLLLFGLNILISKRIHVHFYIVYSYI